MTDENEIDKHYLKFDRPHIYACSCGFVTHIFGGTQTVEEEPKGEIKYMECGHAVCAKTEKFECVICIVKG